MANAHIYLATRVVAVGTVFTGMAGFDASLGQAASINNT